MFNHICAQFVHNYYLLNICCFCTTICGCTKGQSSSVIYIILMRLLLIYYSPSSSVNMRHLFLQTQTFVFQSWASLLESTLNFNIQFCYHFKQDALLIICPNVLDLLYRHQLCDFPSLRIMSQLSQCGISKSLLNYLIKKNERRPTNNIFPAINNYIIYV